MLVMKNLKLSPYLNHTLARSTRDSWGGQLQYRLCLSTTVKGDAICGIYSFNRFFVLL